MADEKNMNKDEDVQVESTAEQQDETTATDESSVNQNKAGKSAFDTVLSILNLIIIKPILQFLKFFWKLSIGGKVTFVVILLIAILIGYIVGRVQGYDRGYDESRDYIQELEGRIDAAQENLSNRR